ncbi:hypothetical protein JW933_10190 [candidate division FCPU426 bacterium]|nr:hypothetical protein [candidate division FCPU426 bacterium]
MRKISILALSAVLAVAISCQAAEKEKIGLTSNYSIIELNNLPIGHTISMSQIAKLPLVIGNRFNIPVFVVITSRIPPQAKEGYEAVPETNWIIPDLTGVTIAAHSKASMDVKINIPKDKALLGRKFHASILLTTAGDPSVKGWKYGLGLGNNILFSIAPKPNEEGLAEVNKNPLDTAFALYPERVDLTNAKPGKRLKIIGQDGKPVTITNNSKQRQLYYLSAVSADKTFLRSDTGAQIREDVGSIVLDDDQMEIDPEQTLPLKVQLDVPKDVDFKKGHLFYVLSIKSGASGSAEKYLQIYVWPGERQLNKSGQKK